MATAIETLDTGYQWPRSVIQYLILAMATSSIVFIEPAPFDLLVIILFGIVLSMGLRFPREMHLAAFCLIVFVLANLAAAALSKDPVTTLRFLSVRIYLVLTWYLFTSLLVSSPYRVTAAIWAGYTVAACIALAWGVLEYFGFIRSELWAGGLRAKGPFKDPNVFAPFLIPIAMFSLKEFYVRQDGFQKSLFALMFLAMALGVLIAFSRGGWLAFLCSFGILMLLILAIQTSLQGRIRVILANLLLILVAFSVLSTAIMTTTIADRFFQRAVISQKYDVKEGGRFYTQQKAIETIGETPIGIGPGRSFVELGIQPHNIYLHVFLESGWFGGLSFFVFLFYTLYRSITLIRWRSNLRLDFFVVFASLAGLLFQSLFIDSTHWRHFWLLLAMCWGLIVVHERYGDESG